MDHFEYPRPSEVSQRGSGNCYQDANCAQSDVAHCGSGYGIAEERKMPQLRYFYMAGELGL